MDSNNTQPTAPQSTPPVAAPVSPVMPAPTTSHKKMGPIIATLVIVLVLIIAAVYLFASRINRSDNITATPHDSTPAQRQDTRPEETTVKPVDGNSDDVQSLQADLNASTNGVDDQNF